MFFFRIHNNCIISNSLKTFNNGDGAFVFEFVTFGLVRAMAREVKYF